MQLLAMRQQWLPHGDDSTDSLALAYWLDKRNQEAMEMSVARAINRIFS